MSQNKLTNHVPPDEVILLEDEAEDELLARALEESLRHYREVEIPRRQFQCLDEQSGFGKPGTSQDDDAFSRHYREVEIPRRQFQCLDEQSGFGKPGTSQDDAAFSSTTGQQVQTPSRPLLYKGKDAEGFDLAAGKTWIYPTNYPVRQYQYDIVNACLFRNTLVSLPTGLGKTFIAAVVMYNFYRWFPQGKVIFMAPTKPLVHQQIDSCYRVMGIPKEDTAELTGSMSPTERTVAWEKKRVFFLTPQVFTNDLTCGACAAASIKCLVVDEAHRALGNHSYCQVMKALLPFNDKFRVLALTATPGSNMQAVRQVVRNLMISHLELRKEESPDIAVFTHKRNMETVIVSLGSYLSNVRERFLLILDRYLVFLRMQKVLYGSMNAHTKFGILKARDMFRQNPPPHVPRGKTGIIEANFAVCISLSHALELLSLYGLRSFLKFLQGVLNESRGTAVVHSYLKNENELQKLLDELQDKLGPDCQAGPDPDQSMAIPSSGWESAPYMYSHPKVEKLQDIVVGHFRSFQEKTAATRTMIFCEYRDIAEEVYHILQKHRPLVKPMTFVGQSSTGKQSKGFSQKQQLKVMRKFKAGGYNTLISTCVGEEGLDIGEVDLIVCFDAHKSPIRLVQRIGRTGRQREGRIVMLVTEGKEHAKFKASMYQNQVMSTKLLEKNHIAPYMYANNPRMIPQGIDPHCHRMFITVPTEVKEETSKKKQRQQDIRRLLGEPSGRKVTGQAGNEGSLLYCTEEELLEFWDGRTVPAFDRLQDMEELHAKRGSELRQAFSMDHVTNKLEKPKILDLGKWLPWQQSVQPAVLLQHTDDSRMLVELMLYAVNKRYQMQPTQTAGLLSQANYLKWPKKRTKGKRAPKQSVKSSTSAPKLCGKKDPEVNEKFSSVPVSHAEGIHASYNSQHRASVTSLQIGTNGVDVESGEKLSDVEVPDRRETVVSEQKSVSPKKDLTYDDLCYFCKNDLFCCNHILSCISTVKRTSKRSRSYSSLDLSIMCNFSEANVTAFDLRQLLSPVTSPVSDPHCTHACQSKSEKDIEIMKLNFDLDFSMFEQGLFEAEVLPEDRPENVIHDVAVSKVDHELQVSDVGQKVEYCAASGNDTKYRNSDLPRIESRNDFVKPPETKIKLPQQSLSSVSPGRFSNVAITPPRGLQMERSHSHEKTPSSVLLSPVSPILGSMLKRPASESPILGSGLKKHVAESPILGSIPTKHVPESPVLGAVLKNLSHNQTLLLPVCSTPKIHKKNLFLGSIMSDATQEQEGYSTSVRAKGDKSQKTVTAGDCEQQLNSGVSEIHTPPRPNFDLFSAAQWSGTLGPTVANLNNKDSLTNTTMLTVTQLLGLVDKELNTAVDIEDPVLPREAMTANKPVRACSDIVPGSWSEHIAQKDSKYQGSVEPSDTSNIKSAIRKSLDKVTSSSLSEEKSERTSCDNDYLHDDDDDIFANISVDCHMFTSQENMSSGTSARWAMGNIPQTETCLLGRSNKSEQCKVECDSDPAAVAPEITKSTKSSIVDYSWSTTTLIGPSCSDGSSEHKLTDFDKNTCMGNSSVKTARNASVISSSADSKTVYFDNKYSPNITGDEKQCTEVSTFVTDKQQEICRSVDFQCQPDVCVALEKESIATCIDSSSHNKTPVDDDSPVIKPLVRNKKINISSTSNESEASSPRRPQNREIKHERIKKSISHLIQDSGCLTARKSNLDTSLPLPLEEDDGDNPQILSDVKRGNNSPSSKRVAHVSSDDDFESQSLLKWKKRSQSKGASKTCRSGNQGKINPVNRKLKHGLRHCAFVESEAEESGSCLSDDDDENGSDLDNYDSSFVNDSGNQTYTDIQAKFLHSVIRSAGDNQGQFKMPACKPSVPIEDVFSQEAADFETSYLEDSFCVNEESQSEVMEASALEVAEAVLEAEAKWKRRKRKRIMYATDCVEGTSENCLKSDSVTRKKRLRIMTLESSDSEKDEDVINVSTTAANIGQVEKQIEVTLPKIHMGCVNTNRSRISGAGNIETQFSCMKSVGCESVSTKETETVTTGEGWDWNDWNFDQAELSSCDRFLEEKNNNKHTLICDNETKSLDEKSVSTKQTETVTVSDGWDWNDWNFDQVELPSCDQSFVEKDNKKHTFISAGATEEKHSLSACSTKVIPKAVRSLNAEFNKETVPTLSGETETRKLPLVEDDNSVLPPPASSSAELPKEQGMKSYGTAVLEACSSSSKTIIMATRQVASAPEIAAALRAVHNINVLVRSVTEADYVISWQLGVLRVRMSDFIRTCPIKSGLAKAVRLLQSGFMKRVLVAENDKLVPVPACRDAASKTTSTHVAYLRQAGIPVLYSCDKADTVRLLAMLTDLECSQNRGIIPLPKDVATVVNHIQFYQSLPGVNIALAMRLCHIFSSVLDFLDRCSNVQKIQEVLGLDAEKAVRIQLVLHHVIKPQG